MVDDDDGAGGLDQPWLFEEPESDRSECALRAGVAAEAAAAAAATYAAAAGK